VSADSSSIVLWQRGVTVAAQPWRYTALHQQDAGCCKTSHWLTRSKQARVAAQSLTPAAPSDTPNAGPPRIDFGPQRLTTATQGSSAVFDSSSALRETTHAGSPRFQQLAHKGQSHSWHGMHSCHRLERGDDTTGRQRSVLQQQRPGGLALCWDSQETSL